MQTSDSRQRDYWQQDHGFRAFVLSTRGTADDDALCVRQLRQFVGDHPEICLDAGGQFSPDAALRLCAALPPDAVKWIADPVRDSDIAATSSLARLTSVSRCLPAEASQRRRWVSQLSVVRLCLRLIHGGRSQR